MYMVKPVGYWTFDTILKELKEVIAELGHFPTTKKLIEINRGDLVHAIDRHGGMNKFRTLLGCELLRKSNGYWTYENTLKELKKVIVELGHIPPYQEFAKINRCDLFGAIDRHGAKVNMGTG